MRRPFPPEDHFFPFFWLAYLLLPVLFLAGRIGPREWALEIAGLVVFVPIYIAGHWARRPREHAAAVAGTVAVGVLLSLFVGGVNTTLLVFSAYFAGRQPPLRHVLVAMLCVVATFALLVGPGGIKLGDAIIPFMFALIVAATQRGVRRLVARNIELREARDEVERLAQLVERERIARDLHDLLGHTLSLIVLKAQLAARLMPAAAAAGTEGVVRELKDIESQTRHALAQVRAVVRGYRTEGLAAECASARALLAEAGIECGMPHPPPCAPSVEGALALVLKEAVTNVVRHSGARTCAIRFEASARALRLVIEDDGRGTGTEPEGAGLKGMRERVAALGGRIARTERMGGGTALHIDVPAAAAGSAPS